MIDEFNLDRDKTATWLELAQAALWVLAEDAQARGDHLTAAKLIEGATWQPQ